MLITRILTALVLLPVMLGALFGLGEAGWAAFTLLITLLGLWEWGRMFAYRPWQHVLLLGTALVLAAWVWLATPMIGTSLHAGVLALWFVLAPLWLARRWVLKNRLAAAALGLALLMPTWLAFLDWRPNADAAWQLLALMALVWLADTAAYFSGKAFGRHKLAPAISPGKSWEGVAGAVVAVTLYTLWIRQSGLFVIEMSLPCWLLIGWGLTAVSIVGDLLESWFKRAAGIKDSSQLLPGHGGVLDRIDSLIAVLSVASAARYFAGV